MFFIINLVNRRQDLRRHTLSKHGDSTTKISCPKCGVQFSRSDALFRHSKSGRCKLDATESVEKIQVQEKVPTVVKETEHFDECLNEFKFFSD